MIARAIAPWSRQAASLTGDGAGGLVFVTTEPTWPGGSGHALAAGGVLLACALGSLAGRWIMARVTRESARSDAGEDPAWAPRAAMAGMLFRMAVAAPLLVLVALGLPEALPPGLISPREAGIWAALGYAGLTALEAREAVRRVARKPD